MSKNLAQRSPRSPALCYTPTPTRSWTTNPRIYLEPSAMFPKIDAQSPDLPDLPIWQLTCHQQLLVSHWCWKRYFRPCAKGFPNTSRLVDFMCSVKLSLTVFLWHKIKAMMNNDGICRVVTSNNVRSAGNEWAAGLAITVVFNKLNASLKHIFYMDPCSASSTMNTNFAIMVVECIQHVSTFKKNMIKICPSHSFVQECPQKLLLYWGWFASKVHLNQVCGRFKNRLEKPRTCIAHLRVPKMQASSKCESSNS